MNDETGQKTRGVQVLHRACDILDIAAAADGGVSHAEFAQMTRLSRATVYRILAVLSERGLLRHQPASGTYTLGVGFLRPRGDSSGSSLLRAAESELLRLRDMIGETVYLAVVEGHEIVSVGKVEGPHTTRSSAALGARKPVYCTSQGKAVLAFLPASERADILRRVRLNALTDRTITDRRRLAAELSIVAAKGFAIDDEEIVAGIRCVGAPVIDSGGKVLGAVSIAGPAWRLSLERVHMLGPELASVGRLIGSQVRSMPARVRDGFDAYRVDVVAPIAPPAFKGLPPVFDPGTGALWHADGLAPKLRRLDVDGSDAAIATFEEAIAGIALSKGHVLKVVTVSGVVHDLDESGGVINRRSIALPPGCDEVRAIARHSDGGLLVAAVDARAGTSVIGVVDEDARFRALFRSESDVTALHWAEATDIVHSASAAAGAVHQWDGTALRLLARLPAGSGRPCALAADARGRTWVALSDGWAVARLDSLGEVEMLVPLPVPAPSGLAFGAAKSARLYVATSRVGVGLDALQAAPLSGHLLALDVDLPD